MTDQPRNDEDRWKEDLREMQRNIDRRMMTYPPLELPEELVLEPEEMITLDGTRDLELQARAVQETRARHAALKAQVDGLLQAWKAEHASLLGQLEAAEEALRDAETDARQVALLYYETKGDGKKSLPFGFGVRYRKAVEYDLDLALNWARENAPALLILDKPRFDKALIGEVIDPPPFVRMREAPTATIPADLGKYLAALE